MVAWNPVRGRLETAGPPVVVATLAAWAGLETATVEARADELTELLEAGRRDPDEVTAAVRPIRERPAI